MSEEHHVHQEEGFCNGISETHELIVINCSSAVLNQIHNFEETTIKKKYQAHLDFPHMYHPWLFTSN